MVAVAPAHAAPNVLVRVVAGPTCAVEQFPPAPECAPRPVAGARIVFIPADTHRHRQVRRSDRSGRITLRLAPGRWTAVPQPVTGLFEATSVVFRVRVRSHHRTRVVVSYDTGIR